MVIYVFVLIGSIENICITKRINNLLKSNNKVLNDINRFNK